MHNSRYLIQLSLIWFAFVTFCFSIPVSFSFAAQADQISILIKPGAIESSRHKAKKKARQLIRKEEFVEFKEHKSLRVKRKLPKMPEVVFSEKEDDQIVHPPKPSVPKKPTPVNAPRSVRDLNDDSLSQEAISVVQNDSSLSTSLVATKRALVLYDSPDQAPMRKLGLAYAIMLRNLLGHFNEFEIDLANVSTYSAGQVELYNVIFYLGSYYDNPLPEAFLNDVSSTTKTIVWFKYNLWQLLNNPALDFAQEYGVNFLGLKGLNETPSESNPTPGFFDTVEYKGKSLVKFYEFDADALIVKADPEIVVTQIVDPLKAEVRVAIKNSKTQETAPYILRSKNFWFVADIPFSFIGPRDRYLVMCDILHNILDSKVTAIHRAMVRLEDVGALVNVQSMRRLSNYLFNQRIPFSVAAIPVYQDPLGAYNGGSAMELSLAQSDNLLSALRYAQTKGGHIVMHGYTHQYGAVANPHTGVSGDDFEFWNVVKNSPVAEDSFAWADERIKSGLIEFHNNGFFPVIFTMPHYQGSPLAHQALAQSFQARYERSFYYTSENPQLNLDVNDPQRDFSVGQFFPYVIYRDYYGQKVLPENLGNIEYDISDIDPSSNIEYGWQELHQNAVHAKVVRDGFASFFFHPFWLEAEVGKPGFSDFRKLINGINRLGYQWISSQELL